MSVTRVRHQINHRRHPLKYTSADPFNIITVDPSDVHAFEPRPTEEEIQDRRVMFDSKGRFDKWENVGYVVDGDWDKKITQEFFFEKLAIRHFLDGVPWEETEYIQKKMETIENGGVWGGCKTKSEARSRLEKWDQVYESIKNEGYRRSPPNGIFTWKKSFDELSVCIGRDGRLIRNSGAKHRLCMARILNVEEIPARVLIRHKRWESIRQQTNNTPPISDYIGHPDIEDTLIRSCGVDCW